MVMSSVLWRSCAGNGNYGCYEFKKTTALSCPDLRVPHLHPHFSDPYILSAFSPKMSSEPRRGGTNGPFTAGHSPLIYYWVSQILHEPAKLSTSSSTPFLCQPCSCEVSVGSFLLSTFHSSEDVRAQHWQFQGPWGSPPHTWTQPR